MCLVLFGCRKNYVYLLEFSAVSVVAELALERYLLSLILIVEIYVRKGSFEFLSMVPNRALLSFKKPLSAVQYRT